MSHRGAVRAALKRGGIIVAANWQVVAVQFVAESAFKLLVAVPILGGAFLVTLLLGQDPSALIATDLRSSLSAVTAALAARPWALAVFLSILGVVVVSGSVVMFYLKGGTVSVLAAADLAAGAVERPPLRLPQFRRAALFSAERFRAGAAGLFRRYLALGLLLMVVYGASVAAYLVVVGLGYRAISETVPFLGWTVVAAALFGATVAWLTVANVFYLLTQIVIAIGGRGVFWSLGEALRFVSGDLRLVARVFLVVLLLVLAATALWAVALAGFGLIAFVPVAGLAVLPLQLGAWLLRSLVFQYLGLTALAAYLTLYRSRAASGSCPPDHGEPTGSQPHSWPT